MPRRTFYRGAGADGNGGSTIDIHAVQVEIDFGHANGGEDSVAVSAVEAEWVTEDHILLCTPAGVATDDHEPHDSALERITAFVADVDPGVGFNVVASAPGGSWGRYVLNILGQ